MQRCLTLSLLLALAAPAARAESVERMTRCELGVAVAVPGFAAVGIITDEKHGICVVDLGNDTITAMPPDVLRRVEQPTGALNILAPIHAARIESTNGRRLGLLAPGARGDANCRFRA